MTFYEAALRVLEESGSPLHFQDITRRSLEKGLLSHIGKTPEITMLSRLAAMARRPRDRKIMVTAKDTFALTDWMLPEDAEALTTTGVVEPNPEEDLPPLRPTERHPEPRAEFIRSIGRQGDRKRGRDEEKRRKYPPIAEVAFELLSEAQTALPPNELLARMRSRELASDELSINQLFDALAEDNQRRLDQQRRPQFGAVRADGGEVQLSVEPQAEAGPPPAEVQAAFCKAVGLTFENGRAQLRAERHAPVPGGLPAASPEDLAVVQTARTAGKEAKRAMARVFRRKLAELETGTFEKSCVKMMHALHFRELKVAKRSKEGPVLTARRKEGSVELRYAVRIIKGNVPIERRHVQDLRRDLGHYAAHVGLLLCAGEARGDARSEATSGGALVMLWCGDALAEKFFEAHVGVSVTKIELFEVDDAFFDQAKVDADEAQRRREERHRERDRGEGGEGRAEETEASEAVTPTGGTPAVERPPAAEGGAPLAAAPQGEGFEGEEEEGEEGEEGDEEGGERIAGQPGQPGQPGEGEGGRRRRRRRRRRGRGRGPRPDGQPGAPPPEGGAAAAPAPAAEAPAAPPPPPPPSGPAPGSGT